MKSFNLENTFELNIMHSRCEICDCIYENTTEKREGLCEECSSEIDTALRDFEEQEEEA